MSKKNSNKKIVAKICKNKCGKFLIILLGIFIILFILFQFAAYSKKPEDIKYGVSFNVGYAMELGLDWKESYIAIMDDLGVKRMRLAAHWDIGEPTKDQYDFSYLDYQLDEARKRDVEIILGVGRRLPRWPECHVPGWAEKITQDNQHAEILEYIEIVVNRYKDYENIIYWQVENEPFLEVFAYEHCGDLDIDFLDEEIALVRELDDTRPILMTDSGNIGRWTESYSRGDIFGTSVYLYFWNPYIGKFRSILPASFYRAKNNLMELLHGDKETILIELSLEPWLIRPLIKTPIDVQLDMMDLDRIKKVVEYAERTNFESQYLWGVEWWYWLKVEHDMPEMWNFIKDLIE